MAQARPPLAYLTDPGAFAQGSVIPPQTPAPAPRLPTASSEWLQDYSMRDIINGTQTAEPWNRTTGDRTRYMGEAFTGYNPQTSNYTGRDPEGRRIDSVFHAGTLQGGVNAPISPGDVGSLANILTTVRTPEGHFMAIARRSNDPNPPAQGMTYSSHVADPQQRPMGIEIFQPEGGIWRQSDYQLQGSRRHETAHGLARRMYPGSETFNSVEAMMAASKVPGDRSAALAEMQRYNEPRHQSVGGATSSMSKYVQSGPELFAENMDGYMRDPAAYKAKFPAAAAALRHMINTNPNVNKYLTLSRADDERSVG